MTRRHSFHFLLWLLVTACTTTQPRSTSPALTHSVYVAPTVQELTEVLDNGVFAIISAGKNTKLPEDADVSPAEIQERAYRLEYDLKSKRYTVISVDGYYDGLHESSFLVTRKPLSTAEIFELGQHYKQDSIIFGSHGENALVYTTGANLGKAYRGRGWSRVTSSKVDHSSIKVQRDQDFMFQLNFDFSKMSPYAATKDLQ